MEHEELERLVDAQGLSFALVSLAQVCFAKAQHLRSSDQAAAQIWDHNGYVILRADGKLKP